jgi:hypothetical protein
LSFLRATRRLRLPFWVLSSAAVGFFAPGLVALWAILLAIGFALLPQPWQVRRPPARRPWSPQGQQWLREQRRPSGPARRVYVLWSEAEWAARSASLPFQPRRRYFSRGPFSLLSNRKS